MWKRIAVALAEGSITGLAGAAVSVVLGSAPPSGAVAYGAAAVTGALTGLVAGSPVWKDSGRRDAGIKLFAGVFLAVASLFGFRKWLAAVVVSGGIPLGDAPFVALPLIAVAIALVLEVDDEFGADALVTGPPPPAPNEGASDDAGAAGPAASPPRAG